MRFHSQNLKKEDRTKELINWRCWWYITEHTEFTCQIVVPSHFWHIDIDLCKNGWQEEAIGFSIACPLFAIWLGFRNNWLYNILEPITKRKDQKYTHGRNIGLSFYGGTLNIHLWADEMESRSVDPKWWDFHIDFKDLILGRSKYSKEILEEGDTQIVMPEGDYPARYKVEKATWKRPRWFKLVKEYIEFDIPIGIPHEGKGENSWDIGMDGTFGIGEEWKGNVHEATKKIALRCLETRQRYGSLNSADYAKWRKDGLKRINHP